MIRQEVRIQAYSYHVPMAMVIHVANSFLCDIHIALEHTYINVKDYEEMKSGLVTCSSNLLFLFNGEDEDEAKCRFQRIFS